MNAGKWLKHDILCLLYYLCRSQCVRRDRELTKYGIVNFNIKTGTHSFPFTSCNVSRNRDTIFGNGCRE